MSTYHLEDIDSDDDDSLLREEYEKKRSKSPTPIPTGSPVAPPPLTPAPSSLESSDVRGNLQRPPKAPMPSKEELLVMMEKVDRDIAAAETQISVLEKKRVCSDMLGGLDLTWGVEILSLICKGVVSE